MRNKTKSSLILLGILIIGVIIGALLTSLIRQERIHRIERMDPRERFFSAMEQIIEPTGAQKKEIEKILKKRYEQIAKVKDAYHQEMRVIFDSLRQDLSLVLSEKQRAQIENHFERVQKRMKQSRLDLWTTELDLTSEQRNKIEKILNNFEMQALPDARGFRPGAMRQPAFKSGFKARIDSLKNEIKAVLTPEQQKKFEKLKERRPPFDFPRGGPDRWENRPKPPFPHDQYR